MIWAPGAFRKAVGSLSVLDSKYLGSRALVCGVLKALLDVNQKKSGLGVSLGHDAL